MLPDHQRNTPWPQEAHTAVVNRPVLYQTVSVFSVERGQYVAAAD